MTKNEVYQHFEDTIIKYLGERMKTDQELCVRVWSSLANVDWYYIKNIPENCHEVSYSFRAAGGLIARVRRQGDYMDWYCCGPYAEVDDEFRRIMRKEGFIYSSDSGICDEPGCLKDIGCGFPTEDGGYRWTCGEHYRKYDEKSKS